MGARAGNGKSLDRIQMLRALASVAVVVHHAITNLESTAGVRSGLNSLGQFKLLGAAGVDLFFVISGFIMLHISRERFGQPAAVRDFLVRRVIRIYPIYWFVSLTILALSATPWLFRSLQLTPNYVIASLLLVPWAKPGNPGGIHPLLDQGWTLSYELMFYLIFAAFLWRGTQRQAALGLPIVFVLLLVLGQALGTGSTTAIFLSSTLTLEFCFGVGLAYWRMRSTSPVLPGNWALWIGMIGFACSAALPEIQAVWRPLIWGVPSALLVHWASSESAAGASSARKLLVQLGDASYSLYLTHALALFAICRVAAHSPPSPLAGLAWQLLAVVASVICGFFTYRLVERPMLARAAVISERWLR